MSVSNTAVRSVRVGAKRTAPLLIIRLLDVLYSIACPYAKVTIKSKEVKALIDTGAKVNIISTELAEKLQLLVTQYTTEIIDVSGKPSPIRGVVENVAVGISSA